MFDRVQAFHCVRERLEVSTQHNVMEDQALYEAEMKSRAVER